MTRAPRTATTAATPWVAAAAVLCLAVVSMLVGAAESDVRALWSDPEVREVFVVSRVPRTLALVLSGASLAVAGLIMQHLARNRFVAPTTAGTVDAAAVGLLVAVLVVPGIAVMGKVLIALVFSLAGTALFIWLIQRVQYKDVLLVPLIGLVLGGVYRAGAEFFAYRNNLTQALNTWFNADFSGIIEGRYETLWLAAAAAGTAYAFANLFTATGMGEAFATNVGVNYRAIMATGLTIAAMSTAVVVVTVGAIPFLGLIVPNVATLLLGDNLRRVLPVTALLGAALVLGCDIVGRLLIHPYEIAVGTIVGVVGSAVFLAILMRRGNRYAAA
ncbi:iron chelate uptake ABC transporter family permease subunit [Nocardioides panacisoli]|uniref:ABC transporter permease n=1 Tax=Nocardioides panacisoli TaxID=627624 RepID=UPI001C636820|nr:iron chelate uptake ABC transporter family permease subunit [Nocardioides panacisoli]QYJ02798.1 iron chelate uptake ABC transporter family permease subunit [Nocardioides panacisoli]